MTLETFFLLSEETKLNQPYSEYKHSLTFCVRHHTHLQYIRLQAYICVCCHGNETRAPTTNLPCSAQLEGTPTIPPSYIWVCTVVWECGERQTDRQTDTQMAVGYIHFASAVPHAKCNNSMSVAWLYMRCCSTSEHTENDHITFASAIRSALLHAICGSGERAGFSVLTQ